MQCPKAVIFDLDNTLAEAFQPPKHELSSRFERVLTLLPTALMSAASLSRVEKDFLPTLSPAAQLENLTLFTANAAQCFDRDGTSWKEIYRFGFTREDHDKIRTALFEAVEGTGLDTSAQKYGEQFVDYEGYIAYTALGLGAPSAERKAWDPDASKRQELRRALQEKLPEFDVYIGGATSVDVTPKGINKAYGVLQYAAQKSLPPGDILYIGDALYEGGNDAVVIPTGVQTISTTDPSETMSIIDELIATCS